MKNKERFAYMFLIFVYLLVGCSGDSSNEDEVFKDLVKNEPIIDTELEKEIFWEKDRREMVLIPAGSLEMGDHFSEGEEDKLPVHTVELDAFYMDIHEVTVVQFREFVNRSGYNYDVSWDDVAKYSPGDDYPMIYVNWNDATAYAKWAGKRLPTEAEWEYVTRGELIGSRYPWGDEVATAEKANYNRAIGKTTVVGSYPANSYGLYDMAGNVRTGMVSGLV